MVRYNDMVIKRTGSDGFLYILDPLPKIIFKQKGFFFANVWIEYAESKR